MNFKERVQWIARTSLIVFILASVTFLSALVAMRYAIQGREVTVPDVVGKTDKQAQDQLASLGIGMRIEDKVYSNMPANTVVRQSPPPKTRVKAGAAEHVALSLGPQKVTIPDLTGKSDRAARIELLRSGMQLGEESVVSVPGAPEDTVLKQDPAPGTLNATSPHANLLVTATQRPAAYVMPELTGGSLGSAEARLSAAGLKVSKITTAQAPGATHGAVLEQSPARGQRVDASVPIELQVAE